MDEVHISGNTGNPDSEFEYTPVSIDTFYDMRLGIDNIKTGIIVLTEHQQDLVNQLLVALDKYAPDRLELLQGRLDDVERLASSIAQFPSLLERANMTTSVRTPEMLVDTLVSYQEDGDTMLHMPSKAILGRGFLVTKIHTFHSMYKLARDFAQMDEAQVKEYADETMTLTFTLMVEDVYIDLLRDGSISREMRCALAKSLLILWEHRADKTVADVAPVLQAVWKARRTLAPAFGTMMGTSELLLVSIQMDSQWTQFIKKRLGDIEVTQAMEEFLFGISYEQIERLRKILKVQGVKAIGRDEVGNYLNDRVKTDINMDYRDFYMLYTVRRDNARARQRLRLPGPTKTLEDFFFRFVLEQGFIVLGA